MQDATIVLELPKVLAHVASFSLTERGKKMVLELAPLEEEDRLKESLSLGQMLPYVESKGKLPISNSCDLTDALMLAVKDGVLLPEDFQAILGDLNMEKEIKKTLLKSEIHNELFDTFLQLPEPEPVRQGILRVFSPSFEIRDNASTELRRIRGQLERRKGELMGKLQKALEANRNYLSGSTYTIRNGHYVLPVQNAYKHVVKGVIQDVSGSGGTAFIEPEALVNASNDILLLEAEEKEEIRRILAELSRIVKGGAKDLSLINEAIAYFDFLQAKSLYAISIDGHLANLSQDGSLFLPNARHPLLDPKKVVPNTFALSGKRRLLVLSGPNAGGKTVAMKTLGTLAIMFKMALPLPCASGAEMPPFPHVYCDIGDSQSLEDALSTFSGHIVHISEILEVAKEGDLVLLDEVGTGTSPREGEAIAYGVLDTLSEKGCYALLSSHFESLKEVALSSQTVENASLYFDEATLSPTYRLRLGVPGGSYGLEVARRIGLDEATLSKAKSFLDKEENEDVNASLRHLNELNLDAERRLEEIKAKEAELQALKAELARQKHDLDRKTRLYEDEKDKMLEEIRSSYEEKAKEAIAVLSNPNAKLHEAIEAKKKLDEAFVSQQKEERFDEPLQVGDKVLYPSLDIEGTIYKIKGEKAEVKTEDGMTFCASIYSLRKIEEITPIAKPKPTSKIDVDALPGPSLPMELNIIGKRVDEAMVELDRYLDKCRLKSFKRVRIIHGLGSGALRRATHEYLKAHSKFVDKYELGGEYEGGGGATIVYLK